MKYDTSPSIPLRARRSRLNPPAAQLWTDLRCRLRRSLEAATTPACFGAIRSCCPSLERFAAVDELLRYLADDLGADLDIKTGMYAELVRCAQIGGPACWLAQTVLWLGLWPGLTAAVSRRAWFWRDSPADLLSEVTNVFTGLVGRMDLTRVRRVVGTLVRSTERDVISAGVRRQRDRVREPVVDFELVPDEIDHEPLDAPPPSRAAVLGPAVAFALLGREGDPVVQALVLGLGPGHIAARLGIKPPAARKRLERARRKLRATLAAAASA
jgi:hypothetical protein